MYFAVNLFSGDLNIKIQGLDFGVFLTFSYMYTVTTRFTWREGRDSYNEVASEI